MTNKTLYTSDNLMYKLLVSPSFRPVRHIVFILAMVAISLSQSSHIFLENTETVAGWIYLLGFSSAVAYVAIGYLHIYVLVPKFLLGKRYLAYLTWSAIGVLVLVCLKPLQEYLVHEILGLGNTRDSYFSTVSVLDLLSDFMLTMLCITGVAMTVLLKGWISESSHVARLEKEYISSEISSVKNRINPDLLFNTLNRIGSLSAEDPDTASGMVLQLSRLLRYELYDGSREKVLLSSEISFLDDYLLLEESYNGPFGHQIETTGDIRRISVPPLIFMSFVQQALRNMDRNETGPSMHLLFSFSEGRLDFTCRYTGGEFPVSDLDAAMRRFRATAGYEPELSLSRCKRENTLILTIVLTDYE